MKSCESSGSARKTPSKKDSIRCKTSSQSPKKKKNSCFRVCKEDKKRSTSTKRDYNDNCCERSEQSELIRNRKNLSDRTHDEKNFLNRTYGQRNTSPKNKNQHKYNQQSQPEIQNCNQNIKHTAADFPQVDPDFQKYCTDSLYASKDTTKIEDRRNSWYPLETTV